DRSETQEPLQVLRENGLLLVLGQALHAEDPRDRPVERHVVRPVRPEHHAVDAHGVDEVAQRLLGVDDASRFIPGPPEDPDPGAIEAGAAEAIDLYLAAFTFDPPLILAGGPFSNRAGGSHDDFADFVPLDRLAELGWRIRLEGSQGKPEREFAGPVTGLQ